MLMSDIMTIPELNLVYTAHHYLLILHSLMFKNMIDRVLKIEHILYHW